MKYVKCPLFIGQLFYRHYTDKYDLLISLFEEITKDYFSKDIKKLINNLFQSIYQAFENNEEGLEKINKIQKDDKDFNDKILQFSIGKLSENINSNLDHIEINDSVPKDAIFYIYSSLIDGLGKWAVARNREISPEDIDEIFHKIIHLEYKT
ncbi:TetR family transcriptional regulator [Staphylococcus shinii]|uniref:TetR family transcriptional regulator n=1 Tax=Staphylococcus shinii TaxID=2912228 RepID=UPI000C34850A|nr:TetR family transcriptional regulator [Staphylococcus shinii]PKI11460.1 TetR family transcriptional regulator [Staphylococcus shinii]